MLNPGLPEKLWLNLDTRLWHATEAKSLARIMSDGEIRAAVGDRYSNSFCYSLGAVCLFDFGPTALDAWGQFRNWQEWFGHQQNTRIAVWLEIDRAKSADHLLDAGATRKQWSATPRSQIIPGVEACHVGPIPLAAVKSGLLIDRDNRELFSVYPILDKTIFEKISVFEATLPLARKESIIERLLAARNRKGHRDTN